MIVAVCAVVAASWALAGVEVMAGLEGGGGWLDKVVAYKKKQFMDDLLNTVPLYDQDQVEIKASLAPMPPGYQDAEWDEQSVLRLVTMIRRSSSVPPALRRLIRDITRPSRRAFDPMLAPLPMKDSLAKIPSLSWHYDNYFNYDRPDEYEEEGRTQPPPDSLSDKDLVLVSNPVESQLPHTMISVKKLKEILWARAVVNRQMPTTTTTQKIRIDTCSFIERIL